MKKVIIIPARYSSSRLPGKPLKDICGQPMVVRVCQAVESLDFDQMVVATDDQRIVEAVEAAGYEAIMTREDHVSGTDRLQEAAQTLGLAPEDIVVNLQGDEPLMPPENLLQVADLLEQATVASVATLFVLEPAVDAIENPNIVKLVQGNDNTVLYFSRAAIPFDRDKQRANDAAVKRHVGIYAYRKSALDAFVGYPEGQLENLEKLEQLRFMENGHKIVAQQARLPIPIGVDTEEDLQSVREIYSKAIK